MVYAERRELLTNQIVAWINSNIQTLAHADLTSLVTSLEAIFLWRQTHLSSSTQDKVNRATELKVTKGDDSFEPKPTLFIYEEVDVMELKINYENNLKLEVKGHGSVVILVQVLGHLNSSQISRTKHIETYNQNSFLDLKSYLLEVTRQSVEFRTCQRYVNNSS